MPDRMVKCGRCERQRTVPSPYRLPVGWLELEEQHSLSAHIRQVFCSWECLAYEAGWRARGPGPTLKTF